MRFAERLRIPGWWWLVILALAASLAVAIFAYVPVVPAGIVTGLITVAVLLVGWGYGNLLVSVDEEALQVGRFRLEGEWIAGAEALDREQSVAAVGARADVRSFLQTRPYVSRLVRVRIDDPADPHPDWLVSSRRPDELAAAIQHLAEAKR